MEKQALKQQFYALIDDYGSEETINMKCIEYKMRFGSKHPFYLNYLAVRSKVQRIKKRLHSTIQ